MPTQSIQYIKAPLFPCTAKILASFGLMLVLATSAFAERTSLKPGTNMFSPAQDVEIGREVSRDAERQLPMLNDRRVNDYLNDLGRRLASKAPGERFPYQFKAVNDMTINAFALPGGFLYVNRGTIDAAETEAQLAGVMAHEIAHVALRHGTNQATKASYWQLPLAILGGVVGSNSVGAVAAQIGAGFAVNSVLLKYSRDAERQADILGAQILHDNNYDPRAMAQFFEKLEGRGGSEFFKSHPNPGNRMALIREEIAKLGGPPAGARSDSAQFHDIERYIQSSPAPPRQNGRRTAQQPFPSENDRAGSVNRPSQPSGRLREFQGDYLSLRYPDNWRLYDRQAGLTIVPDGGIVDRGQGSELAYGVMIGVFEPRGNRRNQMDLQSATDQLVDSLQQSNPGMQIQRDERSTINGQAAFETLLINDSPVGGRERNWLVTILRPEGLLYLIMVAPESEAASYERAFQQMLDSVRLPRA